MKFRDHPALQHKGLPNWPPLWVEMDTYQMIKGEVGVLTDVRVRNSDGCCLFLTISHDGGSFFGVLFFDNQPACLPVYEFLTIHVRQTIEKIGGMEFN